MKLFLTKDFNENFLNDTDLSCIIADYILISDKNNYIKNEYDNETISDLTFEDIYQKADVWRVGSSIEPFKIIHEPALELKTFETGYSFYSWPIKIDVGSNIIQNNKNKKLRCIGLLNNFHLIGLLYFNEAEEGILLGDVSKEINVLLTLDEKEIDENTRTYLSEKILKNSHNETTDLVRYLSDNTLKLKITNNKTDKEECYALIVTQTENEIDAGGILSDYNIFNPSGAPLIITKNDTASAKPFMSLSNFNNSVIIDNDGKFKTFVLNDEGINYSIFSKSIMPSTGSIDVFVDTAIHKGEGSDFVMNSYSVSSTITGYDDAEGNVIINAVNANTYADDSTFINVNNLSGKETDFALGNSILLNSVGCYYDNGNSRSEMSFNTYGTLNASSYNKSDYDWGNSNNSVIMIGPNISSVNINGNNAMFLGINGLVTNKKENSYIIGSFNDPFNDPLMTISTGWFNKTLAPKLFKLEEHYVYEVDKSWIKREDLVSVYDDKDITYTYYEGEELVSGTISNATCIKMGDTYITPNEIVVNEERIEMNDVIDIGSIEGDVFDGKESPYTGVKTEIQNLKHSNNSFGITLTNEDFGNSNTMSLDRLKSILNEKLDMTFYDDTVYLMYLTFLDKENKNNKKYIVDGNNNKKMIQNGKAVTCTRVNIFNDIIVNV